MFASMEYVVAGTIALDNWEPRYLNLLWNWVNIRSPANINTALAATPPPILLDTINDCDTGATSVRMRCTVYVPPPSVLILLADELIPVEAWHMIWGSLVTENLNTYYRAVIDRLRVALVFSTPNSLSTLLTYEPKSSLVDAVLLKHFHVMLIRNLLGLDPSVRRATGSLITTTECEREDRKSVVFTFRDF